MGPASESFRSSIAAAEPAWLSPPLARGQRLAAFLPGSPVEPRSCSAAVSTGGVSSGPVRVGLLVLQAGLSQPSWLLCQILTLLPPCGLVPGECSPGWDGGLPWA